MVEGILPVALNAVRDKMGSGGPNHAGLPRCHFLVRAGGGEVALPPLAKTTCNPTSCD